MIRYGIFALAIITTAATAIAAIAPHRMADGASVHNITIIEKNQAFPQFGPLYEEDCEHEYCSEETSG